MARSSLSVLIFWSLALGWPGTSAAYDPCEPRTESLQLTLTSVTVNGSPSMENLGTVAEIQPLGPGQIFFGSGAVGRALRRP
jgi:hypothetical protein